MVSFTETFQNVDKLHLGGYVNLDKLQGGLMLSGACSKEPVIFLEQFTTRVVTKISSCRVNTRSRRGIKRLGISFGSIFLLFSNKSSRGPLS